MKAIVGRISEALSDTNDIDELDARITQADLVGNTAFSKIIMPSFDLLKKPLPEITNDGITSKPAGATC